ncbi:hypothetical protein B296_00012611 [Ensete ventricosum]|uniref:Uncharacterized protein n=1 Tax=Ensete ventricosum TaxID=4639 RepID=A0A427B0X9_ENSVE|nr:hypothetical protein B296_00012611 [Ensete ventricosum]
MPSWARCSFVAIGGDGCANGAVAIERQGGNGVPSCCRGGQQWYGARDHSGHVQFVASRDQGSWQRKITAGSICAVRDRCWLRSRRMAARDC